MLATSSSTFAPTLHATSSRHAPLLLRGTLDGELAASFSSQSSSTPSTSTTAFNDTSANSIRTPLFTWSNLLNIVSSGNLQQLARHPDDLREYFAWMQDIRSTYGSTASFLLAERFTATYLLQRPSSPTSKVGKEVRCFRSHFEPGLECQILLNDWPYSVPQGVKHYVVWSYLPILHSDLVSSAQEEIRDKAWDIVAKRGLCGTLTRKTGLQVPTMEDHKRNMPELSFESKQQEQQVATALQEACGELVSFIGRHWNTKEVELAFFANPSSLQSVPALAHFHVLVKEE